MSLSPVDKEELLHFLDNNGQIMNFSCLEFSNFTYEIVGHGILRDPSPKDVFYNSDETDWLGTYLSEASSSSAIKLCLNLLGYYKKVYCKLSNHSFDKKEYNYLLNLFIHYKDHSIFGNYLFSYNVYEADKEIQDDTRVLLQYSESNPSDTILHSTKLLESVYKYILNCLKVPYNTGDRKETLIQLNKKVCQCLKLSAKKQPQTKIGNKAAELLGNFSDIASVMAFFRDKFSSHGKPPYSKYNIKLPQRYAMLCLGSVAVVTRFLMDTLEVRINDR